MGSTTTRTTAAPVPAYDLYHPRRRVHEVLQDKAQPVHPRCRQWQTRCGEAAQLDPALCSATIRDQSPRVARPRRRADQTNRCRLQCRTETEPANDDRMLCCGLALRRAAWDHPCAASESQ
jgi:hypothetical protein